MEPVAVIAYFADDPTRTYQLAQWLPVLEVLDHQQPVVVVVRDPASARVVESRTRLRVLTAVTLSELSDLYVDLAADVVLYCNNSMLNFQSLLDGRLLHAHINHGESDKQSMASNNAKAYDRVFVAGEAAVQRHATSLLEFDTSRLVRIGRPQLDLRPAPLLAPVDHPGRRTVLYAPTWEGDADYNNYTSVDTLGATIVRGVLALPDVRLVYKPHPKITTSRTPAVRDAHRQLLDLVRTADRHDPAAGHVAITTGDILAVVPDCDAMVTDVSSVGLDWLYLRTERPLFITDRHDDAERLRREVPVSRCADVLDAGEGADRLDVAEVTALLGARLGSDEHHLARIAMRHHYFGDLQIGESTVRFLDAVTDLVVLHRRLVGSGDATGAITA